MLSQQTMNMNDESRLGQSNGTLQVIQQFGPPIIIGRIEQLCNAVTHSRYLCLQLHALPFKLLHLLVEMTFGGIHLEVRLKLRYFFHRLNLFYKFLEVLVL